MTSNVFHGVFSGPFATGGVARAFDADVLAWEAAVVAAGGGVTLSRRIVVDQLVYALKVGGIWTELDRLWLHAAENVQQATIDLVVRSTVTLINSPTFTVDRGYTGNGTTSAVSSGINSNAGGLKYLRDNASEGAWVVTEAANTGGVDFAWDYGAFSMFIGRFSPSLIRWEINAALNDSGTAAHGGNTTGLFHSQRTGANTSRLLRNGVQMHTSPASSQALQAKPFGTHAYIAGGPSNFSSSQIGAHFFGSSLSGKEAAFYNAMRAYMTAVGVP